MLEVCPEFTRYASNAEGIRRSFEVAFTRNHQAHMVVAGMGVTLVPRLSVANDALQSPRRRRSTSPYIRYLPIVEPRRQRPPKRRVSLVWRRSFTRYEAIAALRATPSMPASCWGGF